MPQHDYYIDNEPSLTVRMDWNEVIEAAVSNNEGNVEPAAPEVGSSSPSRAGMFWFDSTTDPGTMKRRNKQDTDPWIVLATDADLVKKTGGTVTGDLAVAGIFANPGFARLRASHEGQNPPADPVPGMLWYDTKTVPNVLKVFSGGVWATAAQLVSPVFTGTVTISAPSLAALNLISQGERRRIISDSAGDRMAFYSPTDVLVGYITDAGDFVSALSGSLKAALAGKQNTLGFTPVRQSAQFPTLYLGSDLAYLYCYQQPQGAANAVYLGTAITSLAPPSTTKIWNRGDLGAVSFIFHDGRWQENEIKTGGSLRYGWDGGHGGEVPGGSWRNLGGDSFGDNNRIAQRSA